MNPVVIIGSGLAGYMLAKEFRKHNCDQPLVIITADSGDFYSKPQLSTALAKQQSAQDLVVQPVCAMQTQLNATIVTNTVVDAIDAKRKVVTFDGGEQAYHTLVLALGAKPLALSVPGIDQVDSLCVNSLEDYARFRDWLVGKKHIGIIGTGLVGCEFMSDLVAAQYRVSMMSMESQPLARLIPAALGEVVQQAYAADGVRWYQRDGVVKVQKNSAQCQVQLESGTQVECDGLLSAVGLKPQLTLAEQAGLKVQQGIVVNRALETSDPHIYALGDCAQVEGMVLQYVAPLLQCARALAKTLAGERTQVCYPAMPVVVKTPACPVVALTPQQKDGVIWRISGDAPDLVAKAHNEAGALVGFALTGAGVKQKMSLLKEVPALLSVS